MTKAEGELKKSGLQPPINNLLGSELLNLNKLLDDIGKTQHAIQNVNHEQQKPIIVDSPAQNTAKAQQAAATQPAVQQAPIPERPQITAAQRMRLRMQEIDAMLED